MDGILDPFGMVEMLIYPQMDLDIFASCYILFGKWLSDMDKNPFKICGSEYDNISKKVDITHSCQIACEPS